MDHDGQILINLDSNAKKYPCKGQTKFPGNLHTLSINRQNTFVVAFFRILVDNVERIGRSLMNYSVIIVCAVSFFLCCRAIYRAQLLKVVSKHNLHEWF